MNNETENRNNYEAEAKEARIFIIAAAVFIVLCFAIFAVTNLIDRTQYVTLTPVVTTSPYGDLPESEKININTATKEELMKLNGVGSVTAENIINYREHNNGFLDVDELTEVSGIGKKTLEKLRPFITA